MSTLMDILVACENQLGWIPKGRDGAQRAKTRAVTHHIITRAMENQNICEADLMMTLAWCRQRRVPITSPLELLPLVRRARDSAPARQPRNDIAEAVKDAIAIESQIDDGQSDYWIGRLVRSDGDGRAPTLSEWRDARGRSEG